MRVIPNGDGSEVLFTPFQAPDMSDDAFAEDVKQVKRDLAALKVVLENAGAATTPDAPGAGAKGTRLDKLLLRPMLELGAWR